MVRSAARINTTIGAYGTLKIDNTGQMYTTESRKDAAVRANPVMNAIILNFLRFSSRYSIEAPTPARATK
jgi:hypothetical protein